MNDVNSVVKQEPVDGTTKLFQKVDIVVFVYSGNINKRINLVENIPVKVKNDFLDPKHQNFLKNIVF